MYNLDFFFLRFLLRKWPLDDVWLLPVGEVGNVRWILDGYLRDVVEEGKRGKDAEEEEKDRA